MTCSARSPDCHEHILGAKRTNEFFPALSSTSAFVQGLCPSFSTDTCLLSVKKMENIAKKTSVELGIFLKENGVPDVVCEAFEHKKVATF